MEKKPELPSTVADLMSYYTTVNSPSFSGDAMRESPRSVRFKNLLIKELIGPAAARVVLDSGGPALSKEKQYQIIAAASIWGDLYYLIRVNATASKRREIVVDTPTLNDNVDWSTAYVRSKRSMKDDSGRPISETDLGAQRLWWTLAQLREISERNPGEAKEELSGPLARDAIKDILAPLYASKMGHPKDPKRSTREGRKRALDRALSSEVFHFGLVLECKRLALKEQRRFEKRASGYYEASKYPWGRTEELLRDELGRRNPRLDAPGIAQLAVKTVRDGRGFFARGISTKRALKRSLGLVSARSLQPSRSYAKKKRPRKSKT